MDNRNHQLLYNNKRSKLLWMILGLAIGMVVLTVWLVSLLTAEQLLKDFESMFAGRLFQAGLVTIGTVFIWPMIWLSNRYVIEIIKSDDVLTIKTWRIIGNNKHILRTDGGNQISLNYHEGRPDFAMTNAPYLTFKVNGKNFIIDMQGNFPQGEDTLFGKQ